MRLGIVARAAMACAVLAVAATAADAKCTRLGFSVNDYGKDGPTKDAMNLLDKYIAKWAADNGIKKYTTGKKSVNCELFLDFGVFDEHTCKAEASVCWGEGGPATTAAAPAAATGATANAPAKKPVPVKTKAPKAAANPAAAPSATPAATAPVRPAAPKAKSGQQS